METEALTIHDAARKYGVSVRTLRYWEEAGMLGSGRDAGGRRVYTPMQTTRMELIFTLRGLRFSVAEIKRMLGGKSKDAIHEVVRSRIAVLSKRRMELDPDLSAMQALERLLGTRGTDGFAGIEALLGELIILPQKLERSIAGMQNQTNITVSLGLGLIDEITRGAGLVGAIQALRERLAKQEGKALDPIRIIDDQNLPARGVLIARRGLAPETFDIAPGGDAVQTIVSKLA